MAVQINAAASAGVNRVTRGAGRSGGDGIGEIRINRQFHVRGAVDQADGRIVGGGEIGYRLGFRLAPKILQAHRVIRAVKTPEPVTDGRRVGIGGSSLKDLDDLSQR